MSAIRDFYLVKKAEIRTANNGSPYLTLTLHNGQKELSAKKWDFSGNPPKTGDVIFIDDATMGEYRGNPQVTINSYRVAAKNDAPIERFVPTTKGDVNLMFLLVQESAKSILNTNLQQLVVSILELHKKKFKKAPAAVTNHHAYLGGLIEHTLDVTKTAIMMARWSPENLNKDLVKAGAILHDIGKIETYTWERGFIERSNLGRLVDHIVVGSMIVQNAAAEMGLELADIQELMHIIVSHHGKQEWGSPVEPATKEAMIVHRADELNFKMAMVDEALANKENQESWIYLKPGNIPFFAG